MRCKLSLLLAWFILCGATYYADPAGSGTTCSLASPCTGQVAIDTATTAGDLICFNDGTYTDDIDFFVSSGSSGSPIIARNCEGGDVIFDLSETIASWTDLGGNIYESNALTQTSPVFFWKGTTWLGALEATCNDVNAEGEWCDNGTTIKIYTTADPDLSTYRIAQGTPIQIRNVSYITIDGFIIQYSSIGIEIGTSFTAPIGDTSNIIVQDSTISYTGTRGIRVIGSADDPTTNVTIDTTTIHGARETGSENGHCIKFDSNAAGDINSVATVSNSTLYDCFKSGIQFSDGWDSLTATGNTIYNTSQGESGFAAAIRCGDGVVGCAISGNTLGGGNNEIGSGIYLQFDLSDIDIDGNTIFGYDWHGIYLFGDGPSDTLISNNVIRDNGTSGIRMASPNATVRVKNNTLEGNGNSSLLGEGVAIEVEAGSSSVNVSNNICYATGSAYCLVEEVGAATITTTNNQFYSTGTNLFQLDDVDYTSLAAYQAVGRVSGDYAGDPLFTDLGNNVLTLSSSSPARQRGADLSADLTDDFNNRLRGNIWDIGAYEQSGEILITGVTFSGVTLAQ